MLLTFSIALVMFDVIFQKRVRVFHRGFKHEKTADSTRLQAECFYCFRGLIYRLLIASYSISAHKVIPFSLLNSFSVY